MMPFSMLHENQRLVSEKFVFFIQFKTHWVPIIIFTKLKLGVVSDFNGKDPKTA